MCTICLQTCISKRTKIYRLKGIKSFRKTNSHNWNKGCYRFVSIHPEQKGPSKQQMNSTRSGTGFRWIQKVSINLGLAWQVWVPVIAPRYSVGEEIQTQKTWFYVKQNGTASHMSPLLSPAPNVTASHMPQLLIIEINKSMPNFFY